MTNNQILIKVFKEYKVAETIKKLIEQSVNDKTYQDLEQYIYIALLEMNNEKLLKLYKNNELKNFIVGIIMNQRNQNRTYYNRKLKNITNYNGNSFSYIEYDEELIENVDEKYNHELDDKIEFIEHELNSYKLDHSGLTYDEMRAGVEYFFLKEYIKSGLSIRELAKKHLKNRSTVYTLINSGRKRIKEKYKKVNKSYEN